MVYLKNMGANNLSRSLGILFILHAIALFLLPQPVPYIQILSPVLSLFCGLLLIGVTQYSSPFQEKLKYYFVIARSMIGLITGLFFYSPLLFDTNNQNFNLGEIILYSGLPWLLFILAIGFSYDQLKPLSRTSSSKPSTNLIVPIAIVIIIMASIVWFLISLGYK